MVSPTTWLLLSLQSWGYRMKPSNLSTRLVSRVTDVWGGTIVETMATTGVGAIDEEGLINAGPDG